LPARAGHSLRPGGYPKNLIIVAFRGYAKVSQLHILRKPLMLISRSTSAPGPKKIVQVDHVPVFPHRRGRWAPGLGLYDLLDRRLEFGVAIN